ncbi:testis-specific serine/threonine-protein kinase 1-like [Colossoma macropomum]|uniref:testis-specific serine/threonine-protein kinase 1-like n=1 Tax=Colossoma macropomum TaxID=42526 RepID=UPI0018653B93|nr:testis-specific serine/threonine-protein kinase 1-like [Colossoma macropomum]
MNDSEVLKKRGYTLGISLGEGSYAKVKSAYSQHLKTSVAIKIINRKTAPQDFLEKFLPREMDILPSLNHSNIVKTFEIFDTSQGKVYMVMELAVQGDLLELIKARGALPEDFCRKLFRQLSLAIQFIHNLDIAHRDLKCENLLLDKDFNLKVSDFGFSKKLEYEGDQMVLSRTFCGSMAYAAPEVLHGFPYDPKVYDVWSMGVVLFIMMCGSMPYDDSNIKKMLRIQREHRVDFPHSASVPSECKDLICRMLHPNVARRIEICSILEHSWLQKKSKASEGIRARPSKACHKNRSKEEPRTSKHGQENSEEPTAEGSTQSTSKSGHKNRREEEPRTSKYVQENSEEPKAEGSTQSKLKACNKNRSKEEPRTSKHGQENSEEPKAEGSTQSTSKSCHNNRREEEPRTSKHDQENSEEPEAESETESSPKSTDRAGGST